MTEKRSATHLVCIISFLFSDMANPWEVESLQDFSFLCCPECSFKSKEACDFENHALHKHPRAVCFFEKQLEVKIEDIIDTKDVIKEEQSLASTLETEKMPAEEFPCSKGFAIQSELDENLPLKKAFRVNSTKRKLKSSTKMIKEVNKKQEDSELKCPGCSSVFLVKEDLKAHMDEQHKKWPCQKCTKVYPSHASLMYHEKARHRHRICESCGKEFAYDYFKSHVNICQFNRVYLKCENFPKFTTFP